MPNDPQPAGRGVALARLAYMAGPRYGEQIDVTSPAVGIGSGPDADVRVEDDSISAVHARLEYDSGHWRVTDMESTNGTAVEGVKLAPHVPTPLPYGATLRLGGVRLQFREVAAADLDAARAEYRPSTPATTLREERSGFRMPVWLAFVLLVIAIAVSIILYIAFAAPTPPPAPQEAPTPAAVSTPPPRAGT